MELEIDNMYNNGNQIQEGVYRLNIVRIPEAEVNTMFRLLYTKEYA